MQLVGAPFDLSYPRVMGILNVTPDSFSDGGRFADTERAVARALAMVEEGADLIDVGGESTRPGAGSVEASREIDRVVPVIEALTENVDIPISIDTSKPEVMQAAVRAGAAMINDVAALRNDGALAMAATLGVPVCLMHMQGEPRTMQQDPHYDDVVADVQGFLGGRVDACLQAGIPRDHILVDPGFGFGKTLPHNVALLAGLDRLVALGYPVLVGISRKSMLGMITGKAVEERKVASVAAGVIAIERGAAVLRVHDVAETVDAVKIWRAVSESGL